MNYFAPVLAFVTVILPGMALAAVTSPETAGFVPLTNIPALFDAGGSTIGTPDGLATFLNNVYRICIGAAAVIAVLQIMRAGILYMGGDSVTEKKDAKNLIALSIGGLILVLSPIIVFSVINPDILSLKINGIEALRPNDIFTAKSLTEAGLRGQFGTTEFCNSFDSVKGPERIKPDSGEKPVCETGWLILDKPAQCPNTPVRLRGEYWCVHVAQTQYLLAYTFMDKTGTKAACRRESIPDYYADETKCKAELDSIRKTAEKTGGPYGPGAGTTFSNFTVVKACERATGAGYRIPADPKAPSCNP